jgi:hypothetical protein
MRSRSTLVHHLPALERERDRTPRWMTGTLSKAALGVRLVGVVGLIGLTGVVSACGATTGAGPASTVTVTVEHAAAPTVERSPAPITRQPPAIAQPVSLKRFEGSYFSLDYSASWYIDAAEADKGGYLDTTFRSSGNPNVLVRVDVSPGVAMVDPAASARQLELTLRPLPYECPGPGRRARSDDPTRSRSGPHARAAHRSTSSVSTSQGHLLPPGQRPASEPPKNSGCFTEPEARTPVGTSTTPSRLPTRMWKGSNLIHPRPETQPREKRHKHEQNELSRPRGITHERQQDAYMSCTHQPGLPAHAAARLESFPVQTEVRQPGMGCLLGPGLPAHAAARLESFPVQTEVRQPGMGCLLGLAHPLRAAGSTITFPYTRTTPTARLSSFKRHSDG